MLTLTTTEPRAQIENPTSKLTSHRLKTMYFLTETLTVRITPDGRQVHHLETRIQSEQEQTDRFHSHNASEAFCQSFLSLKAAGLYLRNSCGAQPESALIRTNKAQSQHMQAYQILKKQMIWARTISHFLSETPGVHPVAPVEAVERHTRSMNKIPMDICLDRCAD